MQLMTLICSESAPVLMTLLQVVIRFLSPILVFWCLLSQSYLKASSPVSHVSKAVAEPDSTQSEFSIAH